MEPFEFDYSYNFSLLSAIELQREKINFGEIISVFENGFTRATPLPGYQPADLRLLLTGFSTEKRFLLLALKDEADKVTFLQIAVADETDVQTNYCG